MSWGVFTLGLNIYTLYRIYKSNIYKKWFRMLWPIFLNFPTIWFIENGNFTWKFLHFILMGFGSGFTKESISFYQITIPWGAFWVLYNIKDWQNKKNYEEEEI